MLATALLRHASHTETTREKLLSFTDNRQDASLQAGHFNDFVHVSLLRCALYAALTQEQELTFDRVARETVLSCGLTIRDIARNAELDHGLQRPRRCGGCSRISPNTGSTKTCAGAGAWYSRTWSMSASYGWGIGDWSHSALMMPAGDSIQQRRSCGQRTGSAHPHSAGPVPPQVGDGSALFTRNAPAADASSRRAAFERVLGPRPRYQRTAHGQPLCAARAITTPRRGFQPQRAQRTRQVSAPAAGSHRGGLSALS